MGKVVKGSQRELSVCEGVSEGVSEGVRMSVNFKFIELLTQLKSLDLQELYFISIQFYAIKHLIKAK